MSPKTAFDPSQHPRGGNPANRGQYSPVDRPDQGDGALDGQPFWLHRTPIANLAPYPRAGVPDVAWAHDPDDIMGPIRDEYGTDVAEATASMLARLRHEEIGVTTDILNSAPDGCQLHGLEYRMKGPESLARKIRSKAIRDDIGTAQAAAGITDGLRYTVISEDHDRVGRTMATILENLRVRGYQIVEVENSYQEGNTYKGLHALVRTPMGNTVEIQAHSEMSMRVKALNHADYEQARRDDADAADRRMLEAVMRERSEALPPPTDILVAIAGCPVTAKVYR